MLLYVEDMAECSVPEDLIVRGEESATNAKTICCKMCPSTILLPKKAQLVSKQVTNFLHLKMINYTFPWLICSFTLHK